MRVLLTNVFGPFVGVMSVARGGLRLRLDLLIVNVCHVSGGRELRRKGGIRLRRSMDAHYIDNCERRVSFSFSGLLEIKKRVAAYTRSVQYVADLYIVVASPIGVCC